MDSKLRGKTNREWGYEAESIAAEYLIGEGYTIRDRNWKSGNIEIDIIAQKERVIAFVEVKARVGNFSDPLDTVDSKRRTKLIRGADIYLQRLDPLYFFRFDIITVSGTKEDYIVEHIPDAFMPPVGGPKR